MESYSDAREALDELERAAASPYVDYPSTPSWYPPAVGVWAGALVAAIAVLVDTTWIGALAIGGLLAVEGAFIGWYTRLHGALPSLRNPPAEFRPLFWSYALGFGAVLLAAIAMWFLSSPWVTAIVVAVLVTGGLSIYERAYAATATGTRARLARLA